MGEKERKEKRKRRERGRIKETEIKRQQENTKREKKYLTQTSWCIHPGVSKQLRRRQLPDR